MTPLHYDEELATVRLVRNPDGTSRIIVLRNALPWVLRRPYLLACDVD